MAGHLISNYFTYTIAILIASVCLSCNRKPPSSTIRIDNQPNEVNAIYNPPQTYEPVIDFAYDKAIMRVFMHTGAFDKTTPIDAYIRVSYASGVPFDLKNFFITFSSPTIGGDNQTRIAYLHQLDNMLTKQDNYTEVKSRVEDMFSSGYSNKNTLNVGSHAISITISRLIGDSKICVFEKLIQVTVITR